MAVDMEKLNAFIGQFVTITLAWTMLLLLAVAMAPPAQAQTFTVLHTFTGGADGSVPGGAGTASACGRYECSQGNYGVVWEITP